MGGVPTNIETEVLRDNDTVVPGLYAAGEVACVSVHGANRLGTNSLLDINVFGRRAGIAAAEFAATRGLGRPAAHARGRRRVAARGAPGRAPAASGSATIRTALQETMDRNAQVFRTEASLKQAESDIAALKERYRRVVVQDKGRRFNTDLLEAVELGFLLDLAEVLVISARARNESRGGHFREDYQHRDDVNFMRHTMAYREVDADGDARASASTTSPFVDPLPADGAHVLMTTDRSSPKPSGRPQGRRGPELRRHPADPPLQPRGRRRAALGGLPGRRCTAPTACSTPCTRSSGSMDGSLTFRRSCAHGVCGSDAMRINGRNRLACKTLLKDLEPRQADHRRADQGPAGREGPRRRHGAVLRSPTARSCRSSSRRATSRPASASSRQADRERFDDTTKCILCAACTSSCPVFWTDGQYFGPAAIVNAHRFIFDSRDEGADLRLEILNDKEGVWRCRTTFNCSEACPRGIEVTKAIQEVKRALLARKI